MAQWDQARGLPAGPAREALMRFLAGLGVSVQDLPTETAALVHARARDGARWNLGRYLLVRELSAGGVGQVYLAWDPTVGRRVAVKAIELERLPEESRDEVAQRFAREVRSLGSFRHPSLVPLFDTGRVAGPNEPASCLYYAMEYLEGRSVAQVLREDGPFDEANAARICAELADALHLAHLARIVHRDVKPSNVFLTTDGRAILLDFAIAKTSDLPLTAEGQIVGTPSYLAPERLNEKEIGIDGRADQFSLGVLLYTMVTGRQPFVGADIMETIEKIVRESHPSLPEGSAASRALGGVLDRLLAKDPEQRFSTAQEAGQSLRRVHQLCALALSDTMVESRSSAAGAHADPRSGSDTLPTGDDPLDITPEEVEATQARPLPPAEPDPAGSDDTPEVVRTTVTDPPAEPPAEPTVAQLTSFETVAWGDDTDRSAGTHTTLDDVGGVTGPMDDPTVADRAPDQISREPTVAAPAPAPSRPSPQRAAAATPTPTEEVRRKRGPRRPRGSGDDTGKRGRVKVRVAAGRRARIPRIWQAALLILATTLSALVGLMLGGQTVRNRRSEATAPQAAPRATTSVDGRDAAERLAEAEAAVAGDELGRAQLLYLAVASDETVSSEDRARASLGAADVARRQGDPVAARRLYRSVLRRHPNSPRANEARLELQALGPEAPRQPASAAPRPKATRSATPAPVPALAPLSPLPADASDEAWCRRVLLEALEDPAGALPALEGLVRRRPRAACAHRALAQRYERAGRTRASVTYYQRFLALAPNDPAAPAIQRRVDKLRARLRVENPQ